MHERQLPSKSLKKERFTEVSHRVYALYFGPNSECIGLPFVQKEDDSFVVVCEIVIDHDGPVCVQVEIQSHGVVRR